MKDRTILAIKGLAIIGVVFHHVVERRLDPEAAHLAHIFIASFHWCVLGFFCVSGYLQALSDSKKTRTLWEFTRVRMIRLLLPFVLLVVFYSCIWQAIQALHFSNIGIKVPKDFLGKLEEGLWPIDSAVAQQLYFFPLLFGISIVLAMTQKSLGLFGTWAAAVLVAGFSLVFFPTYFTGFSWGVFLWGISFYATGYLLFHYRDRKRAIRVLLLCVTLLFYAGSGSIGLIRVIPLWLLSEGHALGLDRSSFLGYLGDASGTIYIYHTPFIILPLAIAATHLPGPAAQYCGILLATAITLALCCLIFEALKNTRAKILLM
jgi:hypothetical protein